MMMDRAISKPWLYTAFLPFCLVVVPVFVDLLNGYLIGLGRSGPLSVGVVFRGAIILFAFYCLLRLRNLMLKTFVFLVFAIFLLSNLIWALMSDVYRFSYELNQGMKIAFPWLVTGIFLYFDQKRRIDSLHMFSLLAWAGLFIGLALIASWAFGVGNDTYGDWSYGKKGFFVAQNDVGLTSALTLVAAMVTLAKKPNIAHLTIPGVIVVGSLILGTRTGIIGPILIIGAFATAAALNRATLAPPSGGRNSAAIAAIVFSVLSSALLAGMLFSNFDKTKFLMQKMEILAEETPRSETETAGAERLRSRGILFNLFGEGGLAFRKSVAEILTRGELERHAGQPEGSGYGRQGAFRVKRVENDIFDVLGFYGLIQFTVIYGGLMFLYWLALRKSVRVCDIEHIGLLIMLTVYLGHSSFAGHALFSGLVGTMIVPVMFLLLRDVHWRPNLNW